MFLYSLHAAEPTSWVFPDPDDEPPVDIPEDDDFPFPEEDDEEAVPA